MSADPSPVETRAQRGPGSAVAADAEANAHTAEDMDGSYYAKDGKVWKSPVSTKNDDGTTSISLGFPVCVMHDAVGKGAAETVAALMNAGAKAAKVLSNGTGREEVAVEPVETCPDCGAVVSGDGISIDETACFRCKGD